VVPTTPTVDDLVAAVSAAFPALDETEQRVAVTLYRTLAEGRPVTARSLADRSGLPEARVAGMLAAWPGVFLGEAERVIAFWGLALPEMPHRYRVGEQQLYTWCAWDTLFITPILNQVAEVESRCPISGRDVSLTVAPQGAGDWSPPGPSCPSSRRSVPGPTTSSRRSATA
jgi:alkylmercury lyase